MATYWIKLWVELLDDPKMGRMPDPLWRLFVELCLLAGRISPNEGRLPGLEDIGWALRREDTAGLQEDLRELARQGVILQEENGWLVKNFAKRQAAVPGDKRYQEFRKRNPDYNRKRSENETFASANEAFIETESEAEKSRSETEQTIPQAAPAGGEEISKRKPRTVDELRQSAQKALQDGVKELETGDKPPPWCPPDLIELCVRFIQASGIKPVIHDRGLWIKDLRNLAAAGITPGLLAEAVNEMRRKELNVSHPGSVEKVARDMLARGKSGSEQDRSRYVTGEYEAFIEH